MIDAIGFAASLPASERGRPDEAASVPPFDHEAHDPEPRSHHGTAALPLLRRDFEIEAPPMGVIASVGDP